LWGVVVADVPFVDVINSMSDETIPLTVTGMGGMGQSAGRKILRLHEIVFTIRQCARD